MDFDRPDLTPLGKVPLTETEERLSKGLMALSPGVFAELAASQSQSPAWPHILAAKNLSMMGLPSLAMLRIFALAAQGHILEIGAYIGGSSLALAWGIAATQKSKLVVIDSVGSYSSHPHLPSHDIEADWHRTLSKFGMSEFAQLIPGNSRDPACCAQVKTALGQEKIGCVSIDADGFVWEHLAHLSDALTDNCLLIVDDYVSPDAAGDAKHKAHRTIASVQHALDCGAIEEFGVLPWGTWFGRATPLLHAAFDALLAAETDRKSQENPVDLPPLAGQSSKSGFKPKF